MPRSLECLECPGPTRSARIGECSRVKRLRAASPARSSAAGGRGQDRTGEELDAYLRPVKPVAPGSQARRRRPHGKQAGKRAGERAGGRGPCLSLAPVGCAARGEKRKPRRASPPFFSLHVEALAPPARYNGRRLRVRVRARSVTGGRPARISISSSLCGAPYQHHARGLRREISRAHLPSSLAAKDRSLASRRPMTPCRHAGRRPALAGVPSIKPPAESGRGGSWRANRASFTAGGSQWQPVPRSTGPVGCAYWARVTPRGPAREGGREHGRTSAAGCASTERVARCSGWRPSRPDNAAARVGRKPVARRRMWGAETCENRCWREAGKHGCHARQLLPIKGQPCHPREWQRCLMLAKAGIPGSSKSRRGGRRWQAGHWRPAGPSPTACSG
jgi:hypothetical protein